MSQPIKVFVSYASEDESFKKELDIQLKLIGRDMSIDVWTYDDILSGQIRADEIKTNLEHADFVLLLVSNNFLADDENIFVINRAIELSKEHKTTVISILIRPTRFTTVELEKLEPLPKSKKPISKWTHSDDAWLEVAKGLKATFRRIEEKTPDSSDNSKNDDNSSKDNNSIENNSDTSSSPSTSYKNIGDGPVLQGLHADKDIHINIYQNSPPPDSPPNSDDDIEKEAEK